MERLIRSLINKYNTSLPLQTVKVLRFLRRLKLKLIIFYSKIKFLLNDNNYKKRISHKIEKKSKLIVVFIISDISLWKLDSLYWMMENSNNYEPIMVLSNFTFLSTREMNDNFQKMMSYFKSLGYRIYGDFKTNYRYQNTFIKRLKPEIVVFTSPYDVFETDFLPQKNYDSFNIYFQYAYNVTNNRSIIDNYTNKFVDLNFVENSFISKYNSNILSRRFDVVGYTEADLINYNTSFFSSAKTNNKMKILYAPHHFETSSFWSFGADFISTILGREDAFELVFKPHPLLKKQLIQKSMYDTKYYSLLEKWELQLEMLIWEKDNAALFNYVDVIIHDSFSFLAVSLYSGKPVFYLSDKSKGHEDILNDFGRLCLEQHYGLKNISDFICLLNNLENNEFSDHKRENRRLFYDSHLRVNHGIAAKNAFIKINNYINIIGSEK
jgi:hypothetical protein